MIARPRHALRVSRLCGLGLDGLLARVARATRAARVAGTARVLRVAFAATCALVPCVAAATGTTYKCQVDGRTVYGDVPCAVGRQSEVPIDATPPLPADRASAAARARDEKKALDGLERDRARRERIEPVSTRAGSDRDKQVKGCAKLTLRAKRAHEDYDRAAGKDRSKAELRMRRADEDFASFCRKR